MLFFFLDPKFCQVYKIINGIISFVIHNVVCQLRESSFPEHILSSLVQAPMHSISVPENF